MTKKARSELKSTGYEIFIAVLSILSIANLVLVLTVVDVESLETVLAAMNGLFSLIFLGDFIYRLATAPSRTAYFFKHFGWADLLASLPFPQLKILRVFRLVRVFRLFRNLGARTIWRTLIKDRAGSALLVLLLMGILVLQFGSLTILYLEDEAPGANITTASDALWYTIVTISTVGYGDRFPVTDAGRLAGTAIIVVGVGIFGTFTGYLANLFLTPRKSDSSAAEVPQAAGEAEAVTVQTETDAVGPRPAEIPTSATADELRALLIRNGAELDEIKRLLLADGDSGRP
jgi:hypothetical protein